MLMLMLGWIVVAAFLALQAVRFVSTIIDRELGITPRPVSSQASRAARRRPTAAQRDMFARLPRRERRRIWRETWQFYAAPPATSPTRSASSSSSVSADRGR